MSDERSFGVFDPERIVRTLDRLGVDYVLIGGVAARLHGSPILTEDVDVTPESSRANLRRLAEALYELNAKLASTDAEDGLDVPLDAETFSSPVMKFMTHAGEIDVVLDPQGLSKSAAASDLMRVRSGDDIDRSSGPRETRDVAATASQLPSRVTCGFAS